LRGATNSDFNNRESFGLFNSSTAGTANNATQVIGVTSGNGIFMPPSGLTYRWYPSCSGATAVTPTITATSTLICEGDTIGFSASGETPYYNISYQWQQSGTPGGPYSNVTGPPSGTTFTTYNPVATPGLFYYVLVTTCAANSASVISNQITMDVRPAPIIGILSSPALNTNVSPIETCFGESYTLTASGANTYTWNGIVTTASYVVQPSGNPTYYIAATSVDGCVSARTLSVQVNPLPVITLLASPGASICPGKPAVIGASGNSTNYAWINPFSTAFLITVTPTTTTTYSVIGTAATGCTNMATQQIEVFNVAPIVASSSGSSTTCQGNKINLSATGSASYTWTAPGTYTTGQMVSVIALTTVIYTVTGIDANGCEGQATLVQSVTGCVGLNEVSNFTSLGIYPNPNNGVFTVELDNGAAKTVDVMDVTGRILLSTSSDDNKIELRISELSGGIYYVRVQSNNATEIVKVVKQ
jgi:hypothetical protein